MRITIDGAGRAVIPKAVREAAGITPGMPLEVRFKDGRIEIEPAPLEVELIERDGIRVAVPLKDVPELTADETEAILARLRAERG